MTSPVDLNEVLDALPWAALVREGDAVVWQNQAAASGWGAALLAGAEGAGGLKVRVIPLAGGRELLLEDKDTEDYLGATSSAISHDLRSPLRGLVGFLGLLERRYAEQLDARGRRYIEQAQGSAEQLERLIVGLVRFLRSERTPLMAEVDLGAVMARVAERRASLLEEVDLSWGELPTVRGDRELLGRLLDALVCNAAQHGAPPIRVEAVSEGAFWVIRVTDVGAGFSGEMRAQAFRPLRRGRSAHAGVGLGLSIARRVARSHGGDVQVEVDEAGRTTLRVSLVKLQAPRSGRAGDEG